MRKQPNFVMIVSDQQRADWLGCYGHEVIKTPHIDALAEQGLRFTDFHTASPVCMPNRASIMTGRYPSVHGLRYNGCALSTRANTFVELLRQSGYQTAAIGKSHLQPFTPFSIDRSQQHFNESFTEAWKETLAPYVHEEPGRYNSSGRYSFPKPYYGYDHVDMVTGHGIECSGHYRQWLNEQTANAAELTDPTQQLEHDYGVPQACRTIMPEELYPTRYIENQTVEWLKNSADPEQPFFLFVSFPDPHHPFNPPGKYWDRYRPEQFDLDNPVEDIEEKPPMLQYAYDRLSQGLYPNTSQESFMATTRHCKEAMALTAGMIEMVDDAVGSIHTALTEAGLDENTVFIYTSDHGDYLGDANLLLKGPWIRTSTHQVPFVWRDPEAPIGQKTDVMSSAIDIAPTILARAGVPPYFGIQGRDLLQDVKTGEGRQQLLIEHNDNVPRMGLTAPSRSRTLYQKEWRLTIYPGEDWGELYHTAADPHHRKNLWFDTEFALKKGELLEQLALEITATMDESPRSIRRA